MYNNNIEETKKLIRTVFEEEKTIHNLDAEIYPVTVINFYQEHMAKLMASKKTISSKINLIKLPIHASGVYMNNPDNQTNSIYMFLKNSGRITKNNRNIYDILFICYHEIQHSNQVNFDQYDYAGFLRDIDNYLKNDSPRDYLTEHSKYSLEIGANLYAANKTKEYIQKNFPSIYEQNKEYIDKRERQAKFYYQTYDASDTIERTIQALKNKSKHNDSLSKEMEEISPILKIFLNSDLSYKTIDDIVSNEKFKMLDKRIIHAFFSNKTFLENINFEELSEENLVLLSESLQYTNTLYQNQLQLLSQEKNINLLEFLKIEKNILMRYKLVDQYYRNKVGHILNFKRNDRSQQQHMESIPNYLEKTNTLIRKRVKDGYITIDVFYIIGLFLSISTIIYLLLKK